MKTLYSTFTVILLLVVSACSSTPTKDIQISSEADPKANFAGYTSYKWLGAAAILNDPDKQWVSPGFDANAEIKYLIDNGLRAKGMTEAAQNPDVAIVYALGVDMANIEYKENPDKSFKTLEALPKGALVILMVDADTGVVIWASSAVAEIQGMAGEDAKKRLQYAVKSMLDTLPK